MDYMGHLTEGQRGAAADALAGVLVEVERGNVEATRGERAYIAGAVAGLRGEAQD